MRTVRLAGTIAVAAVIAAGPSPADAAVRNTAVFTLDVDQRLLTDTLERPLAGQLAGWASQCHIDPGGALFVLNCPGPEALEQAPTPDNQQDGSSRTAAPADPGARFLSTLALFRDLDETIYLAACPVAQEPAGPNDADSSAGAGEPRFAPDDLRDCAQLEAGQTFSAQVEGDRLRIVTRGRQLALRVFEIRQKLLTTDTPYLSTPSQSLGHAGPRTRRKLEGLQAQNQARWEPPDTRASASGKPSSQTLAGVAPAKTSLRTGRLTIDCASRRAFVLIDGAYVGSCPATLPLIAGPHTIVIRAPGKSDQLREIRIEAGETKKIRLR